MCDILYLFCFLSCLIVRAEWSVRRRWPFTIHLWARLHSSSTNQQTRIDSSETTSKSENNFFSNRSQLFLPISAHFPFSISVFESPLPFLGIAVDTQKSERELFTILTGIYRILPSYWILYYVETLTRSLTLSQIQSLFGFIFPKFKYWSVKRLVKILIIVPRILARIWKTKTVNLRKSGTNFSNVQAVSCKNKKMPT